MSTHQMNSATHSSSLNVGTIRRHCLELIATLALMISASSSYAQVIDLLSLDSNAGLTLLGPTTTSAPADNRVDTAGDINGDGFNDFVLTAPSASGEVRAYVVFGAPGNADEPLILEEMIPGNGFWITGNFVDVAGVGDINDDGVDDLLVGTAVIYGTTNSLPQSFDLATLNGTNGFQFTHNGSTVRSVAASAAGDVNAAIKCC